MNKDQALAASTAFADFLNILAEQEGGNVEEVQMNHIQKEFSEMFTNWSRLSQLSVGFMMYLDSRIEADGYLIKVTKCHRLWSIINPIGDKAPKLWQPV